MSVIMLTRESYSSTERNTQAVSTSSFISTAMIANAASGAPERMAMSKAKLLRQIRLTPCLACGRLPSDAAHVRSKKSTGNDNAWNLIPLCRRDHQLQHQLGWLRFFAIYPEVKNHLMLKGWMFESLNGKYLMFEPEAK